VSQSGALQRLRRITVHPRPSVTTDTGLKAHCEIGGNLYPKGVNVSDREMAERNIKATHSTPSGTTPSRPINNHLEAVISPQILNDAN
jgi:hypothetical protein